jgi:alcohol dehydrogenase (cytochrome c)
MNRRTTFMVAGLTIAALPAFAAEVTPERLINADREPQNWLMNHRTYDSQRYSPLDKINKANVKSLKIAYAVAIGGTSANENLEATPLAEDGFLYLTEGRALQDRRPLGRPGPDRMAHGPGAGKD